MSESFEDSLKRLEESGTGEDFKRAVFECGSYVHDEQQLKRFEETVQRAREIVFKLDPSFKEEVEGRQREITLQQEQELTSVKNQVKDTIRKAKEQVETDKLRITAELAKHRDEEITTEKWVEEHRLKAVKKPEELKDKLICPIGGCPDMGNTVNGVSFCFQHQHKLVPRSELKNYNRAYRRNHLRSMRR
jgi:hypothetical protein